MTTLVAITAPGLPEMLLILAIFVLLFGAKKLPDLGSSVGRSIKNFKKGVEEGGQDDEDEAVEQSDAPATRDGQ